MILLILGLVSVVALTPVLYWYYILFRNRGLNGVPGPKPTILMGNVFSKDPYELYDDFLRLHKEYGPTVKFYVGPYVHVMFSKPEHMQAILSSTVHLDKTFGYEILKPWLGEGLIIARAKKWKGRRRLLSPSFHFKILDEFMHTFNSAADILVDKVLVKHVGKDSVEMFELTSAFTLDVICETAMGVKINSQTEEHNEHAENLNQILNVIMWRFFCVWASIDFLFWLFAHDTYKIYTNCINNIKHFTNGVIERRRKEYKEINSKSAKEVDEFYAKPKRALLDFLLTCEEANSLTTEDMREEIENFMFAGHDTTSTGLSLMLLELSRNPDIQQKLYEEINLMVEDGVEITAKTLNDMPYLDLVMKEGLRRRSPVALIQRKIAADCEIDGIKFVKGNIVSMHISYLHMDPTIYPEPLKFIPERFLQEEQSKRHNYAYIPFSAGSRNCLGFKFALLEMKVTLAKILKRYEVLPVPGFQERIGFTGVFKSKNGACVRLRKRKE